jgi:deazaflavin-dependent oxidoreductase (nitroreductase family)
MANSIISNQPKGMLRFLFRLPIWLYHANLGWLLSGRFLMLTHIGRKSGKPRQAVLEVVAHEPGTEAYFVAAAWRGKADWFKNIQANPDVRVTVGTRTFKASALVTNREEASAIFLDYARRYPLAFRELGHMIMGQRLHPTPDDCLRLAQSVPMVRLAAGTND